MKIMEGIKEWMLSNRSGHDCFFCGTRQSEDANTVLYDYKDVLVCRRCLCVTKTSSDLAQTYWAHFPEKMPACMNCRQLPPEGDLWVAIGPEWHFCTDCLDHDDVKAHWQRVCRKLYERRWKELGIRKCR
jgi:hypothetical protein